MPIGIVSDKDFEAEIKNLGIKQRSETTYPSISDEMLDRQRIDAEVVKIEKGRGEGNVEVPNGLRRAIGETAITDGRQEALHLAASFGISPSSVSAYSKGATSTASMSERPNSDIIKNAKQKISKRARGKLLMALKHITEDKLRDAKLTDVASVAKDMSTIAKNMEDGPTNGEGQETSPRFVVYAPQFRQENHYETVRVNE